MKRWLAIILAAAIALSMAACTAEQPPETTPPTTTAATTEAPTEATTAATTEATTEPTTAPEKLSTGVYGDTIILGNLKFAIPEGFLTTVIDERTITLTSKDGKYTIGLFAADISALDEEKAKIYIPLQHGSFVDENDLAEANEVDGYVAGMEVKYDLYVDINTDLQFSTNMATTFTDSWYAYTILVISTADSDLIKDYTTTFAEFTAYAENIGEAPRFDFVQ